MKRRDTLKSLMMASAGLVALPAWAREWSFEKADRTFLPAFITVDEAATLAAVADTFIPAAGAIGALDVEVDVFLIKLFANCYDAEVRENLRLQFNKLETSSAEAFGKSFAGSSQAEREGLLLAMAASGDPDQVAFFELMKGETIRGFLTSRRVMREYSDYVVAPGHFHGCVDLSKS